jgi:hypothetical protein
VVLVVVQVLLQVSQMVQLEDQALSFCVTQTLGQLQLVLV